MRRRSESRNRTKLLWYGIGIALVQIGLAIAIDQGSTSVRDPDFHDMLVRLNARRRDFPDRRLVIAMGSSRTQVGLDGESLTKRAGEKALLVFNGSISGAGPMLRSVALRRLLDAGVRPDALFYEIMPVFVSAAEGIPTEEGLSYHLRYSTQEVASIANCFDNPLRLLPTWGGARLFPCGAHVAELRDAIGADAAKGPPPNRFGRDDFGWRPYAGDTTPAAVERGNAVTLKIYRDALGDAKTSPGALRAVRNTLQTCMDERIRTVVFCPPEATFLREFDREAASRHFEEVRRLALEFGFPFVDAREWCDDADFCDGHHLTKAGARRYTERFGRELLPFVEHRKSPPVPAQAVSHVRP